MEKHSWKDLHKIVVGVVKSDVENCEGDLVVIVYVAGYCCYMVQKKISFNFCQDLISCNRDIHDNLPESRKYTEICRGGLLHP